MRKLRLLLFEECNRNCIDCCNKDWDLKSLPIEDNYRGYNEILLTGGEPMLDPLLIIKTIKRIQYDVSKFTKIYLYTAKPYPPFELLGILNFVDGITITLHEQWDVEEFRFFNNLILNSNINKSFRLNIFRNIDISSLDLSKWKVKKDIEWIKNRPLPEGEILKRAY